MCLFNISHFSTTHCSEVMSKRKQEDAGEERVPAKSKPMMNLVSRCNVRNLNVLASTASESPVKTDMKVKSPELAGTGNNQPVCSLSTQTGLSLMTMMWTLKPLQNQTFL